MKTLQALRRGSKICSTECCPQDGQGDMAENKTPEFEPPQVGMES